MNTPAPCTPIQTIKAPDIPKTLLEPCEMPSHTEIRTNADLLRMISSFLQAFDVCSAKHDALIKAIEHKGE